MKRVMLVLCCVALAACSGSIDGALLDGGAADITIEAAIQPRMTGLLRSLSAVLGSQAQPVILDGAAIGRSMAASPGVRSVNLENTGPASLAGSASIARVQDILASEGTPFVVWQEAGGNRVRITLDRDTVPGLVAMLSEEAVEYLTALMAPVVIGEQMTKTEYLSLVASLYGRPIADEIEGSRVHVEIAVPSDSLQESGTLQSGTVTAISGGEVRNGKAVFDIPLLDLLVLETPLVWEIAW